MGSFLRFRAIPTPQSFTGRGADDADHSLRARVDVDVLHRHHLLAFAATAAERFEEGGIGAG
jgi:hypothetical protein